MNCKPQELAMILSPHVAHGRFVTTLRVASPSGERLSGNVFCGDGGPAWVVSGSIPFPHLGVVSLAVISDSSLRPIRDPGDDAVDETLLRLPSPRQEVTA